MCGIAGILTHSPDVSRNTDMASRMAKALHHRGPDDAGVQCRKLSGNRFVALAHRRLSIIDVTSLGHQPMADSRDRCLLSYNGEVYNFLELRKELESRGIEFRSHCDTEVVINAYAEWGLDAFDRFNGMWAMAIVDQDAQRLVLSRDRLGIKPLYYTWVEGDLLFASEIKAILSDPRVSRALNRQAVSDYFSYRYPLGRNTFFESIYSLEPGHHLVVDASGARHIRHWSLPIVPDKPDPGPDTVAEQTSQLLSVAVTKRLVSDVPVGAYLSGGLDSSIMTAFMSENMGSGIHSFTIGFPEEGYNEFGYARQVSEKCGTRHHQLELERSRYLELLPTVIGFKDAPLSVPNEVPLFVLSEELKRHITVVISGEGADELFGGYGRIFRSAFDFQRCHDPAFKSKLSQAGLSEFEANISERYGAPIPQDPLDHFLHQYTYLPLHVKKDLLSPDAFSMETNELLQRQHFSTVFDKLNGLGLQEKYIYMFQTIHLLGLLHRLDTTTMARSVEARVPFVDHELIEFVSALPLDYKMPWKSDTHRRQAAVLNSGQISEVFDTPKAILRQLAAPHLPSEIITRKKVGFPVPLAPWAAAEAEAPFLDQLRDPMARVRALLNEKTLDRILAPDRDGKQPEMLLWMLLNLELWMGQYDVHV